MAQRVGLINALVSATQDKDFGALLDALTPATGFVIDGGLAVTAGSVAAGRCLVQCTRTSTTPNGVVWAVFENTAAVTIDTTGTKKVWVGINQANIDDATQNIDANGLNIGSIQTGAAYPASNFVPLASIVGGVITDERPATTLGSHVVNGILKLSKSADIASATTTDLSTLTGNYAHVTGTATITSFGTLAAGTEITLEFEAAATLTHNATSLILPGGADIVAAAGDVAKFISEGSGNWRCASYVKAN